MFQEGVADPVGFPAAGRTGDQPGVLHGQRAPGPDGYRPGMGIILTMPDQMAPVRASSGWVAYAPLRWPWHGRVSSSAPLVCAVSGLGWMHRGNGPVPGTDDEKPMAQVFLGAI